MTYLVQSITFSDCPGLARVMMTAFNTDPDWIKLWEPYMTMDRIIHQVTERMPKNLVEGRDTNRIQKAIDSETGEIVGYARWVLPEDTSLLYWQEAQVPLATAEEQEDFQARYDAVTGEDGRSKGLKKKGSWQAKLTEERESWDMEKEVQHLSMSANELKQKAIDL
jgi:hypothetical protein